MDTLSLIMAYEGGDLDWDNTLKLFAELVKTGQAWTLQGHYGRTASQMIREGYLDKEGNILNKE